MRAGSWTVFGSVLSQALRFGANLALTRLLFPEAFGLMAVLQAIILAASLLSDVGLEQSLIRSPRGQERVFLDTVWSLQLIKGIVLWLALLLLAPALAAAYGREEIRQTVPVIGLSLLIAGFESTKTRQASRALQAKTVTLVELASQALGVSVMIGWAVWWPSPWALIGGHVGSTLSRVLLSHMAFPGEANRWRLEPSALREVVSYGSWVLLSSGVTFLAGEGRQLFYAALTDLSTIGMMTLAGTLSLVFWNALQQVCQRVLFPAYSELWRERPQDLPRVLRRSRLIQLGASLPVSLLLAALGDRLVATIYDDRYAIAGAYLEVLAASSLFGFVASSYSGVLLAIGRPQWNTALTSLQVILFVGCSLLGRQLLGPHGLVLGGACTGLLLTPLTTLAFARLGLADWRLDLGSLALGILTLAAVLQFGAWSRL